MRYFVKDSENVREIEVILKGKEFKLIIENVEKSFPVRSIHGARFYCEEGTWRPLPILKGNSLYSSSELLQLFRGYLPSGLSLGDGNQLVTQMPGKVVKVLVNEGQEVKKGDVLVVIEAMKMENEFKAPKDGEVSSVHVESGQAIDAGHVMIELA